MPRASRWFVRSALIHLGLGFTIGALLLWNKGFLISPLLWRLLPAHIEFVLLGWTLQLALGVAYWILPRFQTARGNPLPVWTAFSLLQMGIWAVALAPYVPGFAGPLTLAGRVAETSAAVAFAWHAWPRIKPPGV